MGYETEEYLEDEELEDDEELYEEPGDWEMRDINLEIGDYPEYKRLEPDENVWEDHPGERERPDWVENPEGPWEERLAETVEQTPNPKLRDEVLEGRDKVEEMERGNEERLEKGEISEQDAEHFENFTLRRAKSSLATKSDFASVNLDFANMIDVADEVNDLRSFNLANVEAKEAIADKVSELGAETTREIAREKYEEGEIDEDTRRLLERKARLAELR